MSKTREWKISVDGREYHLSCSESGNKFDLYMDGAHMTRMWANREEMQEQNVTIGGKVCQFVIYDGEPDLAVDGVLLGALEDERKTARWHRLASLILGILLVCVGTVAVVSWTLLYLAGDVVIGGWLALLAGLGITAGGIVLLIRLIRRKTPDFGG